MTKYNKNLRKALLICTAGLASLLLSLGCVSTSTARREEDKPTSYASHYEFDDFSSIGIEASSAFFTSGDINKDGRLDIVVLTNDSVEGRSRMNFYKNKFPKPTQENLSKSKNSYYEFSDFGSIESSGTQQPSSIVADFDGDGDEDIAVLKKIAEGRYIIDFYENKFPRKTQKNLSKGEKKN